ncbi:hypothetical protein VNO77_02449 [Canavalia gladiata]|uniref:Uncharacterized protein n=1 Tax=Canavalia gladiata TaxID=3824 RepID=A0AAN9R329_CANGL
MSDIRVFIIFDKRHETPLTSAFSSTLRKHLSKTLAGFGVASGPSLLGPKMTSDRVFPSLYVNRRGMALGRN